MDRMTIAAPAPILTPGRRFVLWLALLLAAVPAVGRVPFDGGRDERILAFLSEVAVQRDASLLVTETIRLRSAGVTIRRGIVRDLPTRYAAGGRTGVALPSITLDGAAEPHAVEPLVNGVRLRIGDAGRPLPPGEHVYRIRYRATRQLRHGRADDAPAWNATGTGWTLQIDAAEARITLPAPARFGERALLTGAEGARRRAAAVVAEAPGTIRVRTTAPLGPGEGLTVAVAWPKSVVVAPGPAIYAIRRAADHAILAAVLKEVAPKNWRGLPLAGELSRMFGSASASASVGPVPSLPRTGRRCAMRPGVVMMETCGRDYGRSRPSVVASATGGWGSCWSAEGWS